jgi:hypothetical protein
MKRRTFVTLSARLAAVLAAKGVRTAEHVDRSTSRHAVLLRFRQRPFYPFRYLT